MAEHTSTRRFPVVCLIASAVLLLVYLFSIGWRSELLVVRNDRVYDVLLYDGSLAGYTVTVSNWAEQTSFTIGPVSWSLELNLLPIVRNKQQGRWAFGLPLWIITLPVWMIAFVRWRRWRRRPAGSCRKCGYNLRETSAERCPECGAVNEPIANEQS